MGEHRRCHLRPGLSPEEKAAAQAPRRDRRGLHRGDVLRGRDGAGPRWIPCGVGKMRQVR